MENIDKNDASGLLVPDVNEDSVDIYDGLDISSSSNTERLSPSASRLKESMDLYEEIVTEDQQNRESSFSELKSRFQAAQHQINELRRRLEQMELQNTGLNTENYRLKKNISALLRTARLEVSRKDAEIQRLTQQSEKGRFYHQAHINNLRDQNLSSSSSTVSSKSRPPHPPPSISLPPLPPGSPPPLPPLPALPLREDCPPQESLHPSSTENDSSIHQTRGSLIETRASKPSSRSHSKSSSIENSDVPDKQTEHSARKSHSCSTARHRESEKQKYKHEEEKGSELTDRRHRTDPNKDCYPSEKNRYHKADRGTGQRHDSRSYKSRDYLSDDGHHKSEKAKRPLSDKLDYTSSSYKKVKHQEQRPDKAKISTPDAEDITTHSSKEGYSKDHKKIKTCGQHKRSADSNHEKYSSDQQKYRSDSSKERTGDRLSEDYHRKADRRHDESRKKHRMSTSSEKSKEHKKQRSKESAQCEMDACSKERKEKTKDAFKRSSEKSTITEKISMEENSPNRKLCFMETLNLTLSPIKKPVLPIDGSQDDVTLEVIENGPDDVSSLPNIEDMCVIDEIVSELDTGLRDVTEQSQDIPKTPTPEQTQICNNTDLYQSETPDADKQKAESTSLKVPNDDPLKNVEEKTKLASDSQADECGSLGVTDGITDTSGSPHKEQPSNSIKKVNLQNIIDHSASEPIERDSSVQLKCKVHKTAVHESLPVDSDKEGTGSSPLMGNPVVKDVPDKGQSQQMLSTGLPQDHRHVLSPPPVSSTIHEKESDAVTSTIRLDSLPQEGLSLPEAIYILTQTNEEASDSNSTTTEPSSSTGCIAVSKVSSTTEESALSRDFTITPKKSFSPGKNCENNSEPSSSMPLPHDEDSMMRTLSNLKRIPDAISPLRSPMQLTKRSHLHVRVKPGYVKSLEKDFSISAVDANIKLDINKENKYPGSTANHDMQNLVDNVADLPSSPSDTELEEGEILSESEETASRSPLPETQKAKLARPIRNKTSPKTLLKRTSKETDETAGISTRSPKSRFKTVCPAATKVYFSNIEEVMETFKLVRAEIRKKYMKLHKTFPKKSFYGVMNNFQESFLQFVDGAQFDQISSQQGELKSKLRKLIASVFNKVLNNGIVKRIFEQQAIDLKQKLWDFVDAQVDYLFKDIFTTLKSLNTPAKTQAEDNRSSEKEKVSVQSPAKKPQFQQKEPHSIPTNPNQIKACPAVPYKTGLGSRGKDIRITHVEKDKNVDHHPTNSPKTQTVVNLLPPKNIPSTSEKNNISSLVVSQNVSLVDKTDFELLTEQQASSLTFNLVRDTQMGEIFKCLLQGSDLLETSAATGDNTSWSLGTPRKDGERFISITTPTKFDSPSKLISPTKFDTPSKLIATWSSISPRKISIPQCKGEVPLNPALFDESCLLELPSENSALLQSCSASQRTYSILAEDLAVSLTIPSPLKSDSHLSFLQPPGMHIMSTPDSVISAHISEDALLDGEDATEQDIHLALDTDNSSCGSSSNVSTEPLATPFVFKPDLPIQALVMEKSNDHFIVKIRQAGKGADITLIADDTLSQTLTEEGQQNAEDSVKTQESQVLSDKLQGNIPSNALPSFANLSTCAASVRVCQDATCSEDESSTLIKDPPHKEVVNSTRHNSSNVCFTEELMEDFQKLSKSLKYLPKTTLTEDFHNSPQSSCTLFGQISQAGSREGTTVTEHESKEINHREEDITVLKGPSKVISSEIGYSPHNLAESSGTVQKRQELDSYGSPEKCEMKVSDSARSFSHEKEEKCCTLETNHKDHGKSGKRKRHQDKLKAKRSKREEESTEEIESDGKNYSEPKSSPSASNNSLNAKNVIKKKGEVVMAWTRDEDRAILVELKTKGASRETFSVLSEKLNKPSGQIARRFYQLMKLYKKMDT